MSLAHIPAALPFIDTLITHLWPKWQAYPLTARECFIILPNQRLVDDAIAAMRARAPSGAILPDCFSLPALGDALERSTLISRLGLPEPLLPVIPDAQRLSILTELILSHGKPLALSPTTAFQLAISLTALWDDWCWHQPDFTALRRLQPAHLPEHWQKHQQLLQIITRRWPERLKELGMTDAATHRVRVIEHLAKRLPDSPHHFIMAGVVQSAPCLLRLAAAIASHPNGLVVCSGLDRAMPEDAFAALPPQHPQYLLKALLEATGHCRADVLDIGTGEPSTPRARFELVQTHLYHGDDFRDQALKARIDGHGLSLAACPTLAEEARVIALKVRASLETSATRIAIVTPHQSLGALVKAELARWGIVPNTSQGDSLADSLVGRFLRLLLAWWQAPTDAIALLALLKHPLCRLTDDASALPYARHLEASLFRKHPAPYSKAQLASCSQPVFAEAFATLSKLWPSTTPRPLADWLRRLTDAATRASQSRVWGHQDGQEAEQALAALTHDTPHPLSLEAFQAMLNHWLGQHRLHKSHQTHPRVFLWGWLESQLQKPDVLILSGLTAAQLPGAMRPAIPWLNRAMTDGVGLPLPEVEQGFAAYLYSHALMAPDVMLTYAHLEGETPQTPSPWLERLHTLCSLHGITLTGQEWLPYSTALHSEPYQPTQAPTPTPTIRPRRISATALELLVKNPYGYYARDILRLRPAKPLNQPFDNRDYGTLLHRILHDFIRTYPDTLPANALDTLLSLAEQAFAQFADTPAIKAFRLPQVRRILETFLEQEQAHRAVYRPWLQEHKASLTVADTEITLTADRIDTRHDTKGVMVIDYKTGTPPTRKEIECGLAWQLTLAGLTISDSPDTGLYYWPLKLNGESKPFTPTGDFWPQAQASLEAILMHYQTAPYLVWPNPTLIKYDDYAHLARRDEWQ